MRPWRDIARELARETDYKRLSELSQELNRALAEQDASLVRLPEKAHIEIKEAEDLSQEMGSENKLSDDHSNASGLKEESEVDEIVEADSDATGKKRA